MARRKGKRKGGRKQKAIPLLPTVASVVPAYNAYKSVGFTSGLPIQLLYEYTGYAAGDKKFYPAKAISTGSLILVSVIGHKIANKTVNRYIRKLSMGYLVL